MLSRISEFRRPLIIVAIFLAVLLFVYAVLPVLRAGQEDTPGEEAEIVGITAENNKIYKSFDAVSKSDFNVKAVYSDGSEVALEFFTLDYSSARPIGESTTFLISYQEGQGADSEAEEDGEETGESLSDEIFTCEVDVAIQREKVAEAQCGYPNITNVTAVLYSNRELAFEGEGDTLAFASEFPWQSFNNVQSVSFDDGVTPTNMNNWFSGMESIVYCDTIPSSVKSMSGTFSGCVGLTESPDLSGCVDLLDISYCFDGCTGLEQASPLPENVRRAEYTYNGCTALSSTGDMTNAKSLYNATGMFMGCTYLTEVYMCPSVQNVSGMFQECINLKIMPAFPATVQDMSSVFSGDISLTVPSTVPASVTNLSSAFLNCQMLAGTLQIDADAEKYDDVFSGAAIATTLNLTGSSTYLDAYADTAESGNILCSKRDVHDE